MRTLRNIAKVTMGNRFQIQFRVGNVFLTQHLSKGFIQVTIICKRRCGHKKHLSQWVQTMEIICQRWANGKNNK